MPTIETASFQFGSIFAAVAIVTLLMSLWQLRPSAKYGGAGAAFVFLMCGGYTIVFGALSASLLAYAYLTP